MNKAELEASVAVLDYPRPEARAKLILQNSFSALSVIFSPPSYYFLYSTYYIRYSIISSQWLSQSPSQITMGKYSLDISTGTSVLIHLQRRHRRFPRRHPPTCLYSGIGCKHATQGRARQLSAHLRDRRAMQRERTSISPH